MVWGGPTRYLPSPLPVPSSPFLKGSDRSPGPGLTPSPQPSCSCRLSKPGAAEVLSRCLRVSQGEEARCARQSWAQAGSWAGGPRPSPLCELPSVCSFVQHHHPSPGLRGARSSEPACLPARPIHRLAPKQVDGPCWGSAEAAQASPRSWQEGLLAADTWPYAGHSPGWWGGWTLAHLFREGGQFKWG